MSSNMNKPPLIVYYRRRRKNLKFLDPEVIAELRARGYPLRNGPIAECIRDFPVGICVGPSASLGKRTKMEDDDEEDPEEVFESDDDTKPISPEKVKKS